MMWYGVAWCVCGVWFLLSGVLWYAVVCYGVLRCVLCSVCCVRVCCVLCGLYHLCVCSNYIIDDY